MQWTKRVKPDQLSPALCRAARGGLGWSQIELALRADVAKSTLADFERGARDTSVEIREGLLTALREGGIKFRSSRSLLLPRQPNSSKS